MMALVLIIAQISSFPILAHPVMLIALLRHLLLQVLTFLSQDLYLEARSSSGMSVLAGNLSYDCGLCHHTNVEGGAVTGSL